MKRLILLFFALALFVPNTWAQFNQITYGTAPAAGSCGAAPQFGIDLTNNVLYTCGSNGVWVAVDRGSASGATDGFLSTGYAACAITQAGGTLVASGPTISGNIPVFSIQTSTTTATITVICGVMIETRLTAAQSAIINSVALRYGNSVGTTATCNAPTIGSQTGPAPGAGETAAAAALVSEGGSLTVTPAIGSCNVTAVSAGQIYEELIAFGTPIVYSTTRKAIYFTQTFVGPTNANWTFYVSGLDVFYTIPGPV